MTYVAFKLNLSFISFLACVMFKGKILFHKQKLYLSEIIHLVLFEWFYDVHLHYRFKGGEGY